MAGLNGTGPFGDGPMTGRGLGYCTEDNQNQPSVYGRGMGRGVGRGLFCRGGRGPKGYFGYNNNNRNNSSDNIESLKKHREILDKRIEELEKGIVS